MMREPLRRALLAHRPQDATEAGAVREVLDALERPADPFDRRTLPGHVTGSAIVLSPEADAVMLVWHRKLGRWLQPGGHVHAEDGSVLATAERETREETGLAELRAPWGATIVHVDAHAIPPLGAEPGHVHYDIRYLLTASRSAAVTANTREVRAASWFDLDALDTLEVDESMRRALHAARRLAAELPH
ncbi:MAG TPA: NUDIX domain-containing protein [Gemmatimonadaceae bacterium]|nr:NUDIX domain-containing protein [Gemmatimonadaceae bacterium]